MQKHKILLLGKYIKKKTTKKSIFEFLKKKYEVKFFDEYQNIKLKKYDLVIIYGYGKILKTKQIKTLGCDIINLHIGYLPFARGIYPLIWSIIFSKPVGFTIHKIINKKIDDGPILFRKKINFKNYDNLRKIHFKCRNEIEKYFFRNFDKIFKNRENKIDIIKTTNHPYFSRKLSTKLLYELPKKWDTTAKYLKNNSINLKKIKKKEQ